MHAKPLAASTGINLERMAAAGMGTSQIGPGDLVEVTIVSGSGLDSPTPTPARVADDGTVMVPPIGDVSIGGLEPAAAEKRIAAAAVERGIYHRPYVTLSLTDRAVNRVSVLGAVAKPGVVELPRGSSDLASALAAAGGLNKEASTRVEVLHRGAAPSFVAYDAAEPMHGDSGSTRLAAHTGHAGQPAFAFDPPGPLEFHEEHSDSPSMNLAHLPTPRVVRIDLAQLERTAGGNRPLEDHDVVMVLPEDPQFIHVTGLVQKPNQFKIPRDTEIRMLDAIAMAGGPSSPVADKVYVIRQLSPMSEPAVIQLSMAKAKRSGEENIRLAPADLISVESTASTMTLDAVTRFFRIAFGINGRMAVF